LSNQKSKVNNHFIKKSSIKYTINGVLFGTVFPLLALLAEVFTGKISLCVTSLTSFVLDPMHIIIATAPIFLGFFAFLAGKKQDLLRISKEEVVKKAEELSRLNRELEVENSQRKKVEEKLRIHQEQLEDLIRERTVDLEKARQEAENANKMKSQFLANMSHEIRTPMNAVLGFTGLLLKNETSEDKREQLEIIGTAGKNLLALINDILDFSKIEADKFEINAHAFPIRKMLSHLEKMLRMKAEEKGIFFEVSGLSRMPEFVLGDELRINQIILNIAGNAIKFTTEGGVIIKCSYEDGIARLAIKDTGIGIPQEKQEQIFKPFVQADGTTARNFGGTGLGLAISLRLANLMGGKITLKSSAGIGSEFTTELPLTETDAPKGAGAIDYVVEESRGKEKLVAVIEDDQGEREFLEVLLEDNGYNTVFIDYTEDFLDVIAGHNVSLVILDLMMNGADGIEINNRLKQDIRTAHLPVIICSANDGDKDSLHYGVIDYIQKPVSEENLLKRIYVGLKSVVGLKNIFIIDDEKPLLKLYSAYLHQHNYLSFAFSSAQDALDELAKGVVPDMIILDLMMPGIDGFEFLKILKKKYGKENIPVVVVTAKDLTQDDITRLKEETLAVYSKGAYTEKEFMAYLNEYFERRKIDGSALLEKWILTAEGDEEFENIMYEAILSLPGFVENLERSILQRSIPEIESFSHSLKGVVSNFEMDEIYRIIAEMNGDVRSGNPDIDKIIRLFVELKEIALSIPYDSIEIKELDDEAPEKEGTLNIVLAEDQPVNQKLVKAYLHEMGLDCDLAENGKIALEILREKSCDLLLLDMQMPVMDGVETIKHIRASADLKDLYVVALTANAMKGDAKMYIDQGCDDYLAKPVDLESLKQKINKAKNRKAG